MMSAQSNVFNVLDFGAVADGATDSTAGFQKAMDEAATVSGAVIVPPGIYMCNKLTMHSGVSIQGYPSWNYRAKAAGSVIQLLSADNECLLDITRAYGATIQGLVLDGRSLGENVHGVLINKDNFGDQEDTPLIDGCQIGCFSGDGIRFNKIWCYSIRHSMIHRNKGHGFHFTGWDGFIMDCWFSGNKGYGIMAGGSGDENSSV
ncbi:MAG: glycoside hydrolase family 55 protein, partial [Treponema sp.]|nr:glycoside hydrolase family 55 protein [Treponema sp.]